MRWKNRHDLSVERRAAEERLMDMQWGKMFGCEIVAVLCVLYFI